MFHKIPKWVRSFPYELDKTALENLARTSKGSFEKPREMILVLYGFSKLEDVNSAIHQFEQQGWDCAHYEQSDEMRKYIIEAKKSEYVINEESYRRDSTFFMKAAKLYNAQYDGWFASN